MKINPEIDYTSSPQVKGILKDIKTAIGANEITIYKMCEKININKCDFSQFLAGSQYRVSEERIRKVVEYINKRDLSGIE